MLYAVTIHRAKIVDDMHSVIDEKSPSKRILVTRDRDAAYQVQQSMNNWLADTMATIQEIEE